MKSFARCGRLGLRSLLDKYPLKLKVKRDSHPISTPGIITLTSDHCRVEIFFERGLVGIHCHDLRRSEMYEVSGFVASQDPRYWVRNGFYCIDENDDSQCIQVLKSVSEMLITYCGDLLDGKATDETRKKYLDFAKFASDSRFPIIQLPDTDPIKIKLLAHDFTWVDDYQLRLANENKD